MVTSISLDLFGTFPVDYLNGTLFQTNDKNVTTIYPHCEEVIAEQKMTTPFNFITKIFTHPGKVKGGFFFGFL